MECDQAGTSVRNSASRLWAKAANGSRDVAATDTADRRCSGKRWRRWAAGCESTVKPCTARYLDSQDIRQISMLGHGEPLPWEFDDGLQVTLPCKVPSDIAVALRIEMSG